MGKTNQIRPHTIRTVPKIFFRTISLFLIFGDLLFSRDPRGVNAAPLVTEKTIVLYDSASGVIPGAPMMNFIDVPGGAALPSYTDGVTVMDTTASGKSTYAGWISSGTSIPGFPLMDPTAGFQVDFIIQLKNESHANYNRAGFSVLLLGDDARGIELAFWQNEIWAQSDDSTGELFTHAEGVEFATTTGLVHYQLTILNDTYTLTADTEPILTGPIRDYSRFDGFPDPYETPNFLFLGDDTTSAEAHVWLSLVSITGTEPIVPTTTSASTPISSPDPLPTDSPPPLISVTATTIPSPTPASNGFESCSLSGLLVLLPAAMMIKRKYRQGIPPLDLDRT